MMDRPYRIHLSSLALNKTADGLIDPKLVLAWLLTAVREAGALLPQLLLARSIQRAQVRKYFWAVGAAVQGLAALGMAAAAVLLPGKTAGWVIIVLLAVLAMARSACSASYKDVLARTVEKGTRGKVSGSAATLGSIVVFAFAAISGCSYLPRPSPQSPLHIFGGLCLIGRAGKRLCSPVVCQGQPLRPPRSRDFLAAGRKTHLTDMDSDGRKSLYTALSNTLIGALLLLGGILGGIADVAGVETVLLILAVLSFSAILSPAVLKGNTQMDHEKRS